jgi:L-histidine N-alpha-methyltransferase
MVLRQAIAACPRCQLAENARMRSPRLIQIDQQEPVARHADLLRELTACPALVSPKYFYDALGSSLFAAITRLPEYYPTRTEAAILRATSMKSRTQLPSGLTLVDIGAGNCEKAARLLAPFGVRSYVAVDISVDFWAIRWPVCSCSTRTCQCSASAPISRGGCSCRRRPATDSVCCSIRVRVSAISRRRRRSTSCASYARRRRVAAVDRRRPAQAGGEVLEAAYDDPLGVTAAFNRNLLRNLNHVDRQ